MAKFNSNEWEGKLQEVENILNNDTLKLKEEFLIKAIDNLNQNLRNIKEDMKTFENLKQGFNATNSMSFKPEEFDNVNGFLSLGSQLERKIDKLRSKIIDEVVD